MWCDLLSTACISNSASPHSLRHGLHFSLPEIHCDRFLREHRKYQDGFLGHAIPGSVQSDFNVFGWQKTHAWLQKGVVSIDLVMDFHIKLDRIPDSYHW